MPGERGHIDEADKFAEVINQLMDELGMDASWCTREELHEAVRACYAVRGKCWDEFVLWCLYGDDTRAKTMALARAQIRTRGGRGWSSRARTSIEDGLLWTGRGGGCTR